MQGFGWGPANKPEPGAATPEALMNTQYREVPEVSGVGGLPDEPGRADVRYSSVRSTRCPDQRKRRALCRCRPAGMELVHHGWVGDIPTTDMREFPL